MGSKPVRDAVRKALDAVPSMLPEDAPPRQPQPPTLADECPVCGAELRVYDRCWLSMKSAEATLACANYCGPACYEEQERRPRDVLLVLRRRQRLARGESV